MNGSDDKSDRFKTFIAVLIAVITVVGAILAWRISVANGAAGSADSEGLAAVLQSVNTDVNISMLLSMNLGLFADYRQHIKKAELLEQDAASTTDAARQAAEREEALRERNVAATARGFVDADYLRVDPATGGETFDGDRYWTVLKAEAAAQQNLDYNTSFAQANRKRDQARGLVGVTIAFSAALFLCTASLATRRRIRFFFAGAAVLIFLTAATAAVFLEILL
jgi:hypothetical protein